MAKDREHPKFLGYFDRFTDQLYAKMQLGHKLYGNDAFREHPLKLLSEVKEELIDISGWSIILYSRIENLEHAIAEAIKNAPRGDYDREVTWGKVTADDEG